MAANLAVIKVGQPEIKNDIEKNGQIEKGKKQAVLRCTNHILDSTIYPKDPKRLNY